MEVISGNAKGLGAFTARTALSILSGAYFAGLKTRQAAYTLGLKRREKVDARVISIGNITAGGTGKTPATIHFARAFLKEGRRTVVLSRGYGRTTAMDKPIAVSDMTTILLSPREAGDEPYLIASKLPGIPVVVCGKRVKGARFAIEKFSPDVILLDDGFQHIALARDEDIVVIDCSNPFGFGHMLPRGLLREPLSGLSRATRFLLTHADEREHGDIIETLKAINPAADIMKSRHRPVGLTRLEGKGRLACDRLSGERVLAVSSIGNPDAFERTLRGLDAEVVNSIAFKDHHWYDSSDIERIEVAAATAGVDHIVTTEKDGVRLGLVAKTVEKLLVLEIELEIID